MDDGVDAGVDDGGEATAASTGLLASQRCTIDTIAPATGSRSQNNSLQFRPASRRRRTVTARLGSSTAMLHTLAKLT